MDAERDDSKLARVAAEPCKSCPYRRDVPSGVWHPDEYVKLAAYDGEIIDQLTKGAIGLFFCHQQDGQLCAGWVACHDIDHLLAFRLHGERVHPSVFEATFKTPVFASGAEAAVHGMKDIEYPGEAAERVMERLARTKGLRRDYEEGEGDADGY